MPSAVPLGGHYAVQHQRLVRYIGAHHSSTVDKTAVFLVEPDEAFEFLTLRPPGDGADVPFHAEVPEQGSDGPEGQVVRARGGV